MNRLPVTPTDVSPEELALAIAHVRAGQPVRLTISSVPDLLKAVELGVVDKAEARRLLGFAPTRGRSATVQPRKGGRFVKASPRSPKGGQ